MTFPSKEPGRLMAGHFVHCSEQKQHIDSFDLSRIFFLAGTKEAVRSAAVVMVVSTPSSIPTGAGTVHLNLDQSVSLRHESELLKEDSCVQLRPPQDAYYHLGAP